MWIQILPSIQVEKFLFSPETYWFYLRFFTLPIPLFWIAFKQHESPPTIFFRCGITFYKQINIYFGEQRNVIHKQATEKYEKQMKEKQIAYHTVYKFIVSTGCINKIRWTTNFQPVAFHHFQCPNIQFILHVDEREKKMCAAKF